MASPAYEQVIELVEQLTQQEKQAVLQYLQEQMAQRELTTEERRKLFESMILDLPWDENWSLRREDWYNDEGR